MLVNPLKNRVYNSFDQKGKRERNIYLIIATSLFIIGSFFIFEFIYEVCNIMGSIISGTPQQALEEFLRMLPLLILTIAVMHLNIYLRCVYKARSEKSRINGFKYNGLVSIIFGSIITIYITVGLITKEYESIVEGYPSLLFPLDVFLGGLLLIGHGVLSYFYGRKLTKESSNILYFEDKRNPHIRKVDHVFYVISYIIASYSLAGFYYIPLVMDFTKGNIFFNVMFALVLLFAVINLFFYTTIFDELSFEDKKKIQKQYSLIFFFANLIIYVLYMISVQVAPESPNLNAFGLLPIEYTASMNVFMIIFLLNNVFAPLIAFVKSLFYKE